MNSISLFSRNKIIFPQAVLIHKFISILRKNTLHIFLAADPAQPFVAEPLILFKLILLKLNFLKLCLSPIFLCQYFLQIRFKLKDLFFQLFDNRRVILLHKIFRLIQFNQLIQSLCAILIFHFNFLIKVTELQPISLYIWFQLNELIAVHLFIIRSFIKVSVLKLTVPLFLLFHFLANILVFYFILVLHFHVLHEVDYDSSEFVLQVEKLTYFLEAGVEILLLVFFNLHLLFNFKDSFLVVVAGKLLIRWSWYLSFWDFVFLNQV